MILLIFIGWIGTIMLGALIANPIRVAIGHDELINNLCITAVSFVILSFYKFRFLPEFEGSFSGDDLRTGMKKSLIIIVYWILTVPVGFVLGYETFGAPTVATVFTALSAGCCEETAFRGLALSYLMRQWKEEKHIVLSVRAEFREIWDRKWNLTEVTEE